MAFYDELNGTATSLLTEFGFTVSVTRAGAKVGTVKAVQVQRKRDDLKGAIANVQTMTSYVSGDERSLLLSAGKLIPKVGDVLSYSKGEWTIKHVEEVNPGGTSLLWKVTAS
jgi:hypothetical protein